MDGQDYFDNSKDIKEFIELYKRDSGKNREHFANALLLSVTGALSDWFHISKSGNCFDINGSGRCFILGCNSMQFSRVRANKDINESEVKLRMSKMIHYKKYKAIIEYSPEDDIVVGEVVGIRDSINFHGRDEQEAIKAFHQSIDNYLRACEKLNRRPNNPTRKTFSNSY